MQFDPVCSTILIDVMFLIAVVAIGKDAVSEWSLTASPFRWCIFPFLSIQVIIATSAIPAFFSASNAAAGMFGLGILVSF